MIFAEAVIRPGMRVLDLGCGAGDATFVAADLMGPGGSVVGMDHSPEALARARLRAGQRRLAQVQFIEGDMHDSAPDGPFDAIVERAALWRDPDPAEVLRRQATVLRPVGLVVAMEPDASPVYWSPRFRCGPSGGLGDRGVRQGRMGQGLGPAAMGHRRRGGAAPAGDDRDPVARRTRLKGRPCRPCVPDARN
jgi:SAM-dependent methyltransferase